MNWLEFLILIWGLLSSIHSFRRLGVLSDTFQIRNFISPNYLFTEGVWGESMTNVNQMIVKII